MKRKSAHESKAKLMRAAEVWDDAQQMVEVLRQNLLKAEPVVRLQIPLSVGHMIYATVQPTCSIADAIAP